MSRRLYFTGTVTMALGKRIIQQIDRLEEEGPEPILIVISSFGGCCRTMMAIRDRIKRCKCVVKTLAVGKAMSAGWFVLCAGTPGHRVATVNTHIMGHGPNGTAPLSEKGLGSMGYYAEYAFKYVAEDTGLDLEIIKKLCDRDYYMFPEEALELGFIDHIAE